MDWDRIILMGTTCGYTVQQTLDMTIRELNHCVRGYKKRLRMRYEIAAWHAQITMTPHVDKKDRWRLNNLLPPDED